MSLDLEEGEEVTSRKKTFIKRAIAFIKARRQANRLTRNNITRDHSGAHERLVTFFYSEDPMYDALKFRKTFRMARPLFNQIVTDVSNHDPFFRTNMDCTGRQAISGLLNVLYQSPLYNDLKTERALEIPFVANGVTYRSGYYLVDEIYPELVPLVKTIPEPSDDDHKRILCKQKQESTKKDVK
nr:transposon protein, putative, Pong sub-class, expressed [Tanacetum cinerariifolium]